MPSFSVADCGQIKSCGMSSCSVADCGQIKSCGMSTCFGGRVVKSCGMSSFSVADCGQIKTCGMSSFVGSFVFDFDQNFNPTVQLLHSGRHPGRLCSAMRRRHFKTCGMSSCFFPWKSCEEIKSCGMSSFVSVEKL